MDAELLDFEIEVGDVDLSKIGVLVVDDELVMARLIGQILTRLDVHQIFTAADGAEALRKLNLLQHDIDIIVCDWNMPKMSGLNFLRTVRSLHPKMPFLMLTGRADVQSIKEAKKHNVDAYIRKPFEPADLARQLVGLARRTRAVAG